MLYIESAALIRAYNIYPAAERICFSREDLLLLKDLCIDALFLVDNITRTLLLNS